jgi:hypothetical protein
MNRTLVLVGLSILLAACASGDTGSFRSSSATPQGPSVISGSGTSSGSFGPVVSGPPGCAGPISEYQQIIDRDVESGMLNPGVYNRVSTDLEPVKRACAEGKEKEAQGQLASVKSRYGYR